MNENSTRRSRLTLLLVVAAFLTPLIIAWVFNFGIEDWEPASKRNHGQLVEPARPLANLSLLAADGSVLREEFLRGKWTLIYILGGECTELCRENLYKMRQVRLALGEDLDRVQRLMVMTDESAAAFSTELQEVYPGLVIGHLPDAQAAGQLSQFQLNDGEGLAASGRVYLVDPLGNLMMSYEPDAEPGGMIKDLELLLKASYVG